MHLHSFTVDKMYAKIKIEYNGYNYVIKLKMLMNRNERGTPSNRKYIHITINKLEILKEW